MAISCLIRGHSWFQFAEDELTEPEMLPPDVVADKQFRFHFVCVDCDASRTKVINICKKSR